ncbi:MAG TPA: acetyl-CoA hydrolase/transferase C-terminal domain-containing protein [Rudaea sp.]|nr:acetyl-CoA hydrolase/transferase C-terminal domain-containing protein [Rudaea sp.]
MSESLVDLAACVQRVLAHAGMHLRLATPLGVGKPNVLLNAIYRHVERDATLTLDIYTALSLARPGAKSELEQRFLAPFLARHFGSDYPDLAWVAAQHASTLPKNIRIHEFYLQSGTMLNVAQAQRDYASMNYTHVARDLVEVGINVLVQVVAQRPSPDGMRYSLACNPDVSLDLLDRIKAAGAPKPLVIGVIHPELPFIGNEAEVGEEMFDIVLRDPQCDHTLFALPRAPIDVAEYALGLHASTLVRDGGTLQIGIGALSDALVYALRLRHQRNQDYQSALAAVNAATPDVSNRIGDRAAFEQGLYGASEMVMDGFMHLTRAGILKRRVFDDFALERALADAVIDPVLSADAAQRLLECGALANVVDGHELARLMRFGLLPQGTCLRDRTLQLPDGTQLPACLEDAASRAAWNRALTGRQLREGRYLRGAFYLGSKDFYAWLRSLTGDAFDGLSMTRVSDINQLYGGREALDTLQRRHARFFNSCMMATALGGAVSDTLSNGQVVSGVGGQYNFVAMAHALEDGRSILMLRSCRNHRGRTQSNILWNYAEQTIPRHLRDIFVTEYGVADLRGKSDEDCIIAMLAIADARFQESLAATAKANGKLRPDFVIPDRWRENTPRRLADGLATLRRQGLFRKFPFGCDFSEDEQRLLPALTRLQQLSAHRRKLAGFLLASLWGSGPDDACKPLLLRMGLDRPRGVREWVWQKLLLRALRTVDASQARAP